MAKVSKNKIINEDALDVLHSLPTNSVDLIYIDPPFNTGKVQKRKRVTSKQSATGTEGFGGKTYEHTEVASSSFNDSFKDFEPWLMQRIAASLRLLKPTGTLCVHLDCNEAHYIKVALDKLLGRDKFLNEIIWAYDYGGRSKKKWSSKHDTILIYVMDPKNYTFNFEAMDRIPYMAPGLVGEEKAARGKTPTDCYSSDTEVLTSDGWVMFSDATINHKFASVDAEHNLVFVDAAKMHKYEYTGEMIRLKTKTIDMLVTPNHEVYCRPKRGSYQFIKAKDLLSYQYVSLPNKLSWQGEPLEYFELPSVSYRVKSQATIYSKFPINPWLELVGRFISDGCTVNYPDRKEVIISELKQRKIEQTDRVLLELGIKYNRTKTGVIIYNKQLFSYFKTLGAGAKNKHIPQELLSLPVENLKYLYAGLLNGDGHIKKVAGQQDQHQYTTISKKLAKQVQELYLKLGYNSTVTEADPANKNWSRRYDVYRRTSTESTLWKKHITKESYDGLVYCATVEPHHTLVVRRNGRVMVGGNCWWHTIVATNGKEKTGYPTQKPLGLIERFIKVHSNPGDVVLDFFAGSGTTLVAAKKNDRTYIGVDTNPDAIAIINNRLLGLDK